MRPSSASTTTMASGTRSRNAKSTSRVSSSPTDRRPLKLADSCWAYGELLARGAARSMGARPFAFPGDGRCHPLPATASGARRTCGGTACRRPLWRPCGSSLETRVLERVVLRLHGQALRSRVVGGPLRPPPALRSPGATLNRANGWSDARYAPRRAASRVASCSADRQRRRAAYSGAWRLAVREPAAGSSAAFDTHIVTGRTMRTCHGAPDCLQEAPDWSPSASGSSGPPLEARRRYSIGWVHARRSSRDRGAHGRDRGARPRRASGGLAERAHLPGRGAEVAFTAFEIDRISDRHLEATVRGAHVEHPRSVVKAATFHALRIEERDGTWSATVIL